MDTLRFLIDRWEYEQIISSENAQVKATHQNTDVGTKPKRSNETSGVDNIVCQLCKLEHRAVDCTKYKTFNARRDRVRTLKLCFNCPRKGHVTKGCLSNSRCRKCGSMHHSALCYSKMAQSVHPSSNNSSNVPSRLTITGMLLVTTIRAMQALCPRLPHQLNQLLQTNCHACTNQCNFN